MAYTRNCERLSNSRQVTKVGWGGVQQFLLLYASRRNRFEYAR